MPYAYYASRLTNITVNGSVRTQEAGCLSYFNMYPYGTFEQIKLVLDQRVKSLLEEL